MESVFTAALMCQRYEKDRSVLTVPAVVEQCLDRELPVFRDPEALLVRLIRDVLRERQEIVQIVLHVHRGVLRVVCVYERLTSLFMYGVMCESS